MNLNVPELTTKKHDANVHIFERSLDDSKIIFSSLKYSQLAKY